MKHNKKTVKTINTVFYIIAVFLMCAYTAAAVIAHNYRRYDGNYVVSSTTMGRRDYGYYFYLAGSDFAVTGFEHKDIVRVTRNEGGYDLEYIMSADGTAGNSNVLDSIFNGEATQDKSDLLTIADNYREYHGFISERMAKEGGIVECFEKVTGRTKYIGFYFTQNGVCVLDDIEIGFWEDGTEYEVSSWGKNFEYDSEYTFRDMLTVPKDERKFWIDSGEAFICERTGYNIYAVLGIVKSAAGTAAAAFGAAALIMTVVRGRRKTAAIGFSVFGAAAAAVFAFTPVQSIAGRYYWADLSNIYITNVIDAILDNEITVAEIERQYEYIDISRNGKGNYIVMFYNDGLLDTICEAKADWRGRLTVKEDGYISDGIGIRLTKDGITVTGKYRPSDTAYAYDRLNPAGFDMRLRYIILLSFALCVVVLLIVSALRYRYRKANPVIDEGSYRIADILYIDKNMDYMKDYMLGNCRGIAVELRDGAFRVDGSDIGIYEYAPKYEARFGSLPDLLKMKRFICVKPAGYERNDGDYGAEYCMLYGKKRRVLVSSVGEQTIAAFALKPFAAKNCGVEV